MTKVALAKASSLSAIAEVGHETSSDSLAEQGGVAELSALHLKRIKNFIGKAQQRAALKGNNRVKALLMSKEPIDKVIESVLYYTQNYQLASVE